MEQMCVLVRERKDGGGKAEKTGIGRKGKEEVIGR